MPRVLIAEGNTPAISASRQADGRPDLAENYARALTHYAPDLETEITQPYFDGWDLDRVDLQSYDGLAVTGSSVEWSAADERARPFWNLCEKAFEAGLPVIGCCWGLQNAAVVLGGKTEAGPNGMEVGFARQVALTEEGRGHPFHEGRTPVFDVLCIHRDDVTFVPEGAVITATNAHTRVQGMVYENGSTQFWGVQYHPEMRLIDVAYVLRKRDIPWPGGAVDANAAADDLDRVFSNPDGEADLRAKRQIGDEIVDVDLHGVELCNWLNTKILKLSELGRDQNPTAT
ncbi:MAG: type 1 glutamine amidotransferase [Pseudomonadota bacterium]